MKIKFVVMLMIGLLLISGCDYVKEKIGSFGGGDKEEETLAEDITGTLGLVFDFVRLPETIMPEQTFDILLDLENKGKTNIENGILTISGYNDAYFTLYTTKKEGIDLEGVSLYTKIGESTTETFRISRTTLPSHLNEYIANFVATACYPYQTEATPTVCINPKLVTGGIASKGECEETDFTLKTQGAPLTVTKVETYYSTDVTFVEFKVFVENKGNGRVRAKEAYKKECVGPALTQEDLGTVKIEGYLGGRKLVCYDLNGNQDSFKLENGQGTAKCKAQIDRTKPAYTSVLNIILDYGYVDSVNKQVKMSRTI
ncbi:hypothetical protein ACFLZ7_03490 [Nanoarchaeota archaeon]